LSLERLSSSQDRPFSGGDEQRPVRILSIDGGGVRGIIPAMVLDAILGPLRAQDVFDVICGTSTGGILACGLCKPDPLSPSDLVALYEEHAADIFPQDIWHQLPGWSLFGPKYSPKPLERHLRRLLGDARLSDVSACDLLVPSYAIQMPKRANGDPRAPLFFRSRRARGAELKPGERKEDYDFPLRHVSRATSAAPTYFPPATVSSASGHPYTLIDAGVFANNPSLCAVTDVLQRCGLSREIVLVSLGTGSIQERFDPAAARRWGKLGWARRFVSVSMDGTADTICAEADELLKENHHRFDISLGPSHESIQVEESLDAASPRNIEALKHKALRLIAHESAKIATVRRLLGAP
jgi:predicted acylesterase/phospholipase RssA